MIENFGFTNLVLWAKNFYAYEEKRYGDIYHFIYTLIKLEGQYTAIDNEDTCVRYCLICLDKLAEYYRKKGISMYWDNHYYIYNEAVRHMSVFNLKSIGEGIIWVTKSILMNTDGDVFYIPIPKYGRKYPRIGCRNNGMTYKEMARIARKTLGC